MILKLAEQPDELHWEGDAASLQGLAPLPGILVGVVPRQGWFLAG